MSEVYEWAGPCANCARTGQIRWSEDRVYDNYCFDCYSLINDGRLLERERIINLLKEAECQGENDWCKTIKQAIVLIEGESK